MQDIIDQFTANLDRVRAIHALFISLSRSIQPVLDISDLLRAEIVLIVSALDHFVHELSRRGMLDVWDGNRPATAAFDRFSVGLGAAKLLADNTSARGVLEAEIRSSHGWKTFQRPEAIAEAVRLFSPVELWKEVATELSISSKDLKTRMELIVDRRNKIAHEADIDPSFPGQRWAIDVSMPEEALVFIEGLGMAIAKVVT